MVSRSFVYLVGLAAVVLLAVLLNDGTVGAVQPPPLAVTLEVPEKVAAGTGFEADLGIESPSDQNLMVYDYKIVMDDGEGTYVLKQAPGLITGGTETHHPIDTVVIWESGVYTFSATVTTTGTTIPVTRTVTIK